MKTLALSVVVGLAAAANAQNATMKLVISNAVLDPSGINAPTTTNVELWCSMDAPVFAFGATKVNINNMLNGLNGVISNVQLAAPVSGGGNASVTGNNDLQTFSPFQVHFPPLFPANTANPILLASFDWTATAAGTYKVAYATDVLDDLGIANRVVVIKTSAGTTANYNGVEADAAWDVIPAPSSLALLGLGGLVAARRRR